MYIYNYNINYLLGYQFSFMCCLLLSPFLLSSSHRGGAFTQLAVLQKSLVIKHQGSRVDVCLDEGDGAEGEQFALALVHYGEDSRNWKTKLEI